MLLAAGPAAAESANKASVMISVEKIEWRKPSTVSIPSKK